MGFSLTGGRDRGIVHKGTIPLSLEAALDDGEYTIRHHLTGGNIILIILYVYIYIGQYYKIY
jgi:hypothetical protein